jgi:hypothetical protein
MVKIDLKNAGKCFFLILKIGQSCDFLLNFNDLKNAFVLDNEGL